MKEKPAKPSADAPDKPAKSSEDTHVKPGQAADETFVAPPQPSKPPVDPAGLTRMAPGSLDLPAVDPAAKTRLAPPASEAASSQMPGSSDQTLVQSQASRKGGENAVSKTEIRPASSAGAAGNTSLLPPIMENLRQRWQENDPIYVESFLDSHPSLRTDPPSKWQLVAAEISLRQQRGDAPSMEEYLRRFPELAIDIKRYYRDRPGDTGPATMATGPGKTGQMIESFEVPLSETLGHAVAPPRPAVVNQEIGDYEILGVLGRGGMGVVYKARQKQLNRLVALKMVLSGSYASEDDLRRFRLEAEASAHLQHPNIVQIYEIGEVDGKPFFSLEYVDGGSLAGKLHGEPQAAYPTAQLVEILARAMHFAHQRGIVHRDLKPANILLGAPPAGGAKTAPQSAYGIPKITDFGLAKRMDIDLKQTQSGAILGTPSYMAPEQASGRIRDIGPPTDIYALGAILYDLLTGRPPFKANTLADTLQQVQMAEPVSPTRLQPMVPRDLAVICLKCLHKEPGRRYPSALALADDLGRFLAGEPIEARPATALERTIKWSKRRPALAALIAVSFLSFLSLGIGGWWSAVSLYEQKKVVEQSLSKEKEAKNEALAANDRAEKARTRAEENLDKALKAVDGMLSEVAAVDLAEIPQMAKSRTKLLHRAVDLFKELPAEDKDKPESRFKASLTDARLGEVETLLDNSKPAENALERARKSLQELCNQFPGDPKYRSELARTEHYLGLLLRASGLNGEAAKVLTEALKQRTDLVKKTPDNSQYMRDQAQSAYWLGATQARIGGQQKQAEKSYLEAIDIQKKLIASVPVGKEGVETRTEYERELARFQNNYAILLGNTGRTKQAIPVLKEALKIQQDLAEKNRDVPTFRRDQARTLHNLAYQHWHTEGSRDTAEQEFAEERTLLEQLARDFPRVPAYRDDLATFYRTRGGLHDERSKGEEINKDEARKELEAADRAFRTALAIHDQIHNEYEQIPEYQLKLCDDYLSLAHLLYDQKQFAASKATLLTALGLQEALVRQFPMSSTYHSNLSHILNNLGATICRINFPPPKFELVPRYRILRLAWQPFVVPIPSIGGPGASLANEIILTDCCLAQEVLEYKALGEVRDLFLRDVEEMKKARELEPRRREYSRFLGEHLDDLCFAETALRNHVGAGRSADELAEFNPLKAAEYLARAYVLVGFDQTLSASARQEIADEYARKALTYVQKYRQVVPDPREQKKAVTSVMSADVWRGLRQRKEFQAVLKEMEEQAATGTL